MDVTRHLKKRFSQEQLLRVSRDQGLDKTHKMLAALILSLVVQPKLAKKERAIIGSCKVWGGS